MRRRAMGQETEYGLSVRLNGKTVRLEDIKLWENPERQFHTDGSRMYLDIGCHPEFSTPECDNPDDIVHHTMAGDRKVRNLFDSQEQTWLERYPGTKEQPNRLEVKLYCNNTSDFSENPNGSDTFGCHENYQLDTWGMAGGLQEFYDPLVAYFATRQLVVGSGWMYYADGKIYYLLCQRSRFIYETFSAASTRSRPIINSRDEPHAKGYARGHIIGGGNNFLPQIRGIKFGLSDVLFTMREERRLKGMWLTHPVRVVRKLGLMRDAKWEASPGQKTGLDVQKFYFDQAWNFVNSDSGLAPKVPAVAEYGRHIDRLNQSLDAADHFGELDWATREVLLEGAWDRIPGGRDRPLEFLAKVRVIELSLQELGENTLMSKLQAKYGRFDPQAVDKAMVAPLSNTRARTRAQIIAELDEADCEREVDWSEITDTTNKRKCKMPDPLDPNNYTWVTKAG